MIIRKFVICLILLCTLDGCATNSTAERGAALANKELEQRGSPFRWSSTSFNDGSATLHRELIGNPCTTAADATLKHDVMASIGQAEAQSGGSASPALIETRCVSFDKSQINEVWVIARGGDKIAYTISLRPQATGGTDFELRGPWGKE